MKGSVGTAGNHPLLLRTHPLRLPEGSGLEGWALGKSPDLRQSHADLLVKEIELVRISLLGSVQGLLCMNGRER